MTFNVADPITNAPAVRQAFALAIDRHALVAKVTHGVFDPDTGMRGLFTWAFDPRAGGQKYDPRRAQALLARERWIPGADGIRVKDGRRLQLQMAFRAGSNIEAGFVSLIVENERAVGIDVTTKRYSREQFIAQNGPLSQGHFQVACLPISPPTIPTHRGCCRATNGLPMVSTSPAIVIRPLTEHCNAEFTYSTAPLGDVPIGSFNGSCSLTHRTIFSAKSARSMFSHQISKDTSGPCSRHTTR